MALISDFSNIDISYIIFSKILCRLRITLELYDKRELRKKYYNKYEVSSTVHEYQIIFLYQNKNKNICDLGRVIMELCDICNTKLLLTDSGRMVGTLLS